jgi:hypothetical protein
MRLAGNKQERGQSMIMFVFMLTGLMGLVALTLDVGMAYRERQNAQGAADAAALAAAGVMFDGGTSTVARERALDIAEENGYVDGENGVSVNVAIPPASGPYTGISGFAEVSIDSRSETTFAGAFDLDFFETAGRAVAGGTQGNTAYGIIALNEHACKAMNLNGTIDIYIQAAGLFVNSDCEEDAFSAVGNVTVDTTVNSVVGGWEMSGNVSVNPMPTHAQPISDPLAGLPVPVPPTNVMPCPTGNWSGTLNLSPGRYECTIDPNGPRSLKFLAGDYHITGGVVANGGGNITFETGVYTLGGVGIQVTGDGRITVNEAMLYIDEGEVELTGNGVTRILAPVSGPYAGISIFQDRTNTTQLDLKGNSLTAGSGVVYAKAANISLVGTSNSSNMQMISDTFEMSGNSSLELDFSDQPLIQQSLLRLVE